jgi:hypothetical protein
LDKLRTFNTHIVVVSNPSQVIPQDAGSIIRGKLSRPSPAAG